MANPYFVNPMGGLNLGAGLSGLGDVFQQRNVMEQQQQEKQDMQAFMRQAIDGDPIAIKEVMVRNPDIGMQMQKIEQQRQQQLGAEQKALFDDRNLDYAKRLRFAQTPEDKQIVMQEAIQDPMSDLFDESDLNAPIEKASFEANALLFDKFGDKVFEALSIGQPKKMTKYQQAMIKGSKADREIRKSEAENKRIDNQLKRETNQVKLEELRNKKIANEDKQLQIKKARSDAAQTVVDSGSSTLDLIYEIENHSGFDSAIGAKGASSLFGLMDEPISGTDAAGVVALIETLEAQNFLTAIGEFKSAGGAGSLSDNEGKKLGAALSNLKTSQNERDFKKSLNVIRNLVKKQVSKATPQVEKRFSLDKTQGSQVTETLSDADLLKKYGG